MEKRRHLLHLNNNNKTRPHKSNIQARFMSLLDAQLLKRNGRHKTSIFPRQRKCLNPQFLLKNPHKI
jgi:hypothetical protein